MDKKKFNSLIKNINFDETAFEDIYKFYFPRIQVFIGRKYNDYHLGEDIAQEFFMKLFRINIPEKIEYPTIWIFNACDNLAKTHFTMHRGKAAVPLNEEVLAARDLNYDPTNLKNGGISEENIEALKKLDAITIEIFVIHFWEGYNYKEIADLLKMRHDSVRRKAAKGLKKLKSILITQQTLMFLLSFLG